MRSLDRDLFVAESRMILISVIVSVLCAFLPFTWYSMPGKGISARHNGEEGGGEFDVLVPLIPPSSSYCLIVPFCLGCLLATLLTQTHVSHKQMSKISCVTILSSWILASFNPSKSDSKMWAWCWNWRRKEVPIEWYWMGAFVVGRSQGACLRSWVLQAGEKLAHVVDMPRLYVSHIFVVCHLQSAISPAANRHSCTPLPAT